MPRATPIVLGLACLLSWGCQREEGATEGEEYGAEDTTEQAAMPEESPAPGTPEAKIENAESAGPEDIAANATIMDWPAAEGGEMTQIRAGTNGWTCMPDEPSTPANDPMCLDEQWMRFISAWVSKTEPQVDGVGIGYMLQGGDAASLTDPFATAPPEGEEWAHEGPHLMIVTPDDAQLAAITTDPTAGGPWVMWSGTPYVHLMVPVEETYE